MEMIGKGPAFPLIRDLDPCLTRECQHRDKDECAADLQKRAGLSKRAWLVASMIRGGVAQDLAMELSDGDVQEVHKSIREYIDLADLILEETEK